MVLWLFKKLILITILFNSYAFAVEVSSVVLNTEKEFDVDSRSLEVYQDYSGKLNIEDILKRSKDFKKNNKRVLGFGFSKATIWIKLPIKNKSLIKDWVLTINFPDLDELIFYKKINGVWVQNYAGDSISTKKWEFLHKDYAFSVDGEGIYYLRVKSRGALSIPLKLMTKKTFLDLKIKGQYFYGGFFSIFGFCIVYNLIMALFLRSKSFLYYCGYLCSVTWMTLILSGVGRALLIDSVWFSNEGFVFSLIFFFFFYLLFTKEFLNVKENFKKINKYYNRSLLCIGLFLFIAPFVPLTYNLNLVAFYAIPSIGTTFFTAIFLFKKHREARLYVYAFLILCTGGVFKALNALGVIPSTFLIETFIFVGFITQVTILSFGLADIINTLLEKTTLAEKKLVESNFELEERVKERTKSLQDSVEKINQLLNNIKQGIFLVDQDNKIGSPVSTFTKEIFEENIEEKDIFKTVFKDMNKKSSEYGDFNFSISCVYNQDILQWLVLKDCFPEKIHYTAKSGTRKKVKLSYNPIFVDEKITNIMYITEDITELEKLQLEAEEIEKERGRYVEILQELSNNKRESLKVYFDNSFKLIHDCLNNLNKISYESDINDNKENFNMVLKRLHTLKGDSLIYGLNSLSAFTHDVETEVVDVSIEFSKMKDVNKLESLKRKIFELEGLLVIYAQCCNDIFKLKFEDVEKLYQKFHREYSLIEYSLFKYLGSIPKITVDPDVYSSFLETENRGKIKERLIKELRGLKNICICLNEKKLITNISGFEKKLNDKEFEKIETFDDFKDIFSSFIKKIEIEVRGKVLTKKEIQAKKVNDKIWAETVCTFYNLYKNLDRFKNQDFTIFLDILKDLTKKTESSYLEMTVALIRSLILRMDLKVRVYLKIFIKEVFLFFIVIIHSQKDGEIINLFLKMLEKENLEVEEFYGDMVNLIGLDRDEIVICFSNSHEIFYFLERLFRRVKNGYPENALLSLIGEQVIEDEHAISKILKDFFGEERFRWGSYIGQIEVVQFSKSFFENYNSEDIVKPEVFEALPENLMYVRNILLKNGQLSDDHLARLFNFLFESPLKYSLNKFKSMINQISSSLGKKVEFRLTGDQGSLGKEKLVLLEEAMVHIIRNSIDHGIEDPSERSNKGKREKGLLEISCKEEKGNILKLVIKDDGKGINVDKLCEKAISTGVLKAEEVEKLNEKEKLNMIFLPSMSTKESVSKISGRGIGMDVVKNSLENIGARLTLESVMDEGTTFTIELPKNLKIDNT
ncbi:ATP-binding protein [Bacteriovoracales bacterium]|nr:ATP-binding protein [Bacteriovoracales bacterium]